jgi:signal peptidase I
MITILNWFLSRTTRQAVDMSRQVRKILNHQRDVLDPKAISAVEAARQELRAGIRSGADKKGLLERMDNLEKVAGKWLKAYPHAGIRENVEVFLVAVAVAMGIRTFFLQPFKIPTGSMQPTLYGIMGENYLGRPDVQFPTGLKKFSDYWLRGISYFHVAAEEDGELNAVEPPKLIFPFVKKQRFLVGNKWYAVWFPPDQLFDGQNRSGIRFGQVFHKNDDILKLKVISGDHLFVDRISYNFRPPQRGEIIVFATRGIAGLDQDQFYIKRLIALGDERVQIGNDRHVIIDGKRLDASTPHFELVYSFTGPPAENNYSGHVNELVANENNRWGLAGKLFYDEQKVYSVKPRHYLVMGDNTMNSKDSRDWGDFPEGNVIGKSCFVYWPILGHQSDHGRVPSRFGWAHLAHH